MAEATPNNTSESPDISVSTYCRYCMQKFLQPRRSKTIKRPFMISPAIHSAAQCVRRSSSNKLTETVMSEPTLVIVPMNVNIVGWHSNSQVIWGVTYWEGTARTVRDRPFSCDMKRYAQQWDLDLHYRAHHCSKGSTQSHPYKCGNCGRAFTQLSNLRTHEWKVTCTNNYLSPL